MHSLQELSVSTVCILRCSTGPLPRHLEDKEFGRQAPCPPSRACQPVVRRKEEISHPGTDSHLFLLGLFPWELQGGGGGSEQSHPNVGMKRENHCGQAERYGVRRSRDLKQRFTTPQREPETPSLLTRRKLLRFS